MLVGNSIGSLACLTAAASAPPGRVAGAVLLNSAGAMNNKGACVARVAPRCACAPAAPAAAQSARSAPRTPALLPLQIKKPKKKLNSSLSFLSPARPPGPLSRCRPPPPAGVTGDPRIILAYPLFLLIDLLLSIRPIASYLFNGRVPPPFASLLFFFLFFLLLLLASLFFCCWLPIAAAAALGWCLLPPAGAQLLPSAFSKHPLPLSLGIAAAARRFRSRDNIRTVLSRVYRNQGAVDDALVELIYGARGKGGGGDGGGFGGFHEGFYEGFVRVRFCFFCCACCAALHGAALLFAEGVGRGEEEGEEEREGEFQKTKNADGRVPSPKDTGLWVVRGRKVISLYNRADIKP